MKKKNVAVEIKRPFPSASVSKGVQVQNLSNKNEFDLHFNEFVGTCSFSYERFPTWTRFETVAKGTRKWPIVTATASYDCLKQGDKMFGALAF